MPKILFFNKKTRTNNLESDENLHIKILSDNKSEFYFISYVKRKLHMLHEIGFRVVGSQRDKCVKWVGVGGTFQTAEGLLGAVSNQTAVGLAGAVSSASRFFSTISTSVGSATLSASLSPSVGGDLTSSPSSPPS